ncbi:MAG TPA: HD domain-containing phosphohydrolase [Pirellulales bacterium]|nr:HD domain-containing phosphohydrolase [Pirellulales bacterium]
MRVLVVDDDLITREIVVEDLRHFGYEVTAASDGREAFELVRTGMYRLVVSDWQMPHMSGLDLCREIRKRGWSGYIYFILLTLRGGVDNVVCGLDAGADDFLTKPFQPQELRMRLRTGERVLGLESRDLMIFAMAKLAESRDKDTGDHLERMREYSRILADELSRWPHYCQMVDGDYVQLIYQTSPLHDIGKVGVPDSILLKPGPLSSEEFEIMQRHTLLGGETLQTVAASRPDALFLKMATEIALTHHERFDGTGYPHRLKGDQIPLCGRIVALADVYDALTSKRVYKPAFDHQKARAIILEGKGTQFDPDVVQAFINREQEFIAVARQFHDDGPTSATPAAPITGLNSLSPLPVAR